MCQGKGDCVFIGNLVQSAIRLCCIMHMQGVLSTLKTPCFVRCRICFILSCSYAWSMERMRP